MRDVYLIGGGMTPFGKHPDKDLKDLGRTACCNALQDAGMAPGDIQAGYCGNALGPILQGQTGVGQHIFWEVGISGIPVMTIENACASGSTAIHEAWMAVAGGFYDTIMVVGVDKAVMPKGSMLNIGKGDLSMQIGEAFPVHFALMAQKHMEQFGTTREQLAKVSVKNHYNGTLNPYAQFNKAMSVTEVLNAPMIADPFTLFSCCPNSDGAACVILGSDRHLSPQTPAIRIAASVLNTGTYVNQRDIGSWEVEIRTAKQAYAMAGVKPEDLSLVELHDAFTITEIIHCEGLGLCPIGEGGAPDRRRRH